VGELRKQRSEDVATMDCLRRERSDIRGDRDRARDCVRELEGGHEWALANLRACTTELEELNRAGTSVCEFMLSSGPSGSSVANRLTMVLDAVRRLVTEGAYLGSYVALVNAASLNRNLDLRMIGEGPANDRTDEEMVAIDLEAK
jgi:hypothetical protein